MPLAESLVAAYRAAEYVVFADPPLLMHIGQSSAALDALLEGAGACAAAFITACNPRGNPHPDADNAAATRALSEDLRKRCYRCHAGEGRDPGGRWKPETSFFVLGMPRVEAEAIGRAYAQNAIVYAERGLAPELVVLA